MDCRQAWRLLCLSETSGGGGTIAWTGYGGEHEPRPVVELQQITKEYPGSPPVRALRGVSLSIRSGELVAIVGQSGSGKSTLLHVMGTLQPPTSGVLRVASLDVSGLRDAELSALRAHVIGFVFQQFCLLDEQTVLENVSNGLLYRGLPASERRERALDALERVGLSHRVKHRPNRLSSGERQRTAIARALIGNPAVVLADEPTGNLDSVSGAAVVELIQELNRDGSTIVVITHDLGIAAAMRRRIEIKDGSILRDSDEVTPA